jgi:hypothetical protein
MNKRNKTKTLRLYFIEKIGDPRMTRTFNPVARMPDELISGKLERIKEIPFWLTLFKPVTQGNIE